MASKNITAIRGPVLTYTGDAFLDGLENTMHYESDAIVVMADGKITQFGPAGEVQSQVPADVEVKNYGSDTVIMAGFIDSHVHYPQTQIIGAFGAQLIDWLNKYTFIAEQQFADKLKAGARAKTERPPERTQTAAGAWELAEQVIADDTADKGGADNLTDEDRTYHANIRTEAETFIRDLGLS